VPLTLFVPAIAFGHVALPALSPFADVEDGHTWTQFDVLADHEPPCGDVLSADATSIITPAALFGHFASGITLAVPMRSPEAARGLHVSDFDTHVLLLQLIKFFPN